jgi:hypothetical protein
MRKSGRSVAAVEVTESVEASERERGRLMVIGDRQSRRATITCFAPRHSAKYFDAAGVGATLSNSAVMRLNHPATMLLSAVPTTATVIHSSTAQMPVSRSTMAAPVRLAAKAAAFPPRALERRECSGSHS